MPMRKLCGLNSNNPDSGTSTSAGEQPSFQFIANPDYDMGMASLAENNIQVGIKIYDQGYKLMSNKMPDECPKQRQAWMHY